MITNLPDATGTVCAILIREHVIEPGLTFFGDPSQPLQLGCMKHPEGHVIPAHVHSLAERKVLGTPEVLFVKTGKVLLNFYPNASYHNTISSSKSGHVLNAGDIVILLSKGHGFRMLEDSELFEVKIGPYLGAADKTLLDVD